MFDEATHQPPRNTLELRVIRQSPFSVEVSRLFLGAEISHCELVEAIFECPNTCVRVQAQER